MLMPVNWPCLLRINYFKVLHSQNSCTLKNSFNIPTKRTSLFEKYSGVASYARVTFQRQCLKEKVLRLCDDDDDYDDDDDDE